MRYEGLDVYFLEINAFNFAPQLNAALSNMLSTVANHYAWSTDSTARFGATTPWAHELLPGRENSVYPDSPYMEIEETVLAALLYTSYGDPGRGLQLLSPLCNSPNDELNQRNLLIYPDGIIHGNELAVCTVSRLVERVAAVRLYLSAGATVVEEPRLVSPSHGEDVSSTSYSKHKDDVPIGVFVLRSSGRHYVDVAPALAFAFRAAWQLDEGAMRLFCGCRLHLLLHRFEFGYRDDPGGVEAAKLRVGALWRRALGGATGAESLFGGVHFVGVAGLPFRPADTNYLRKMFLAVIELIHALVPN